MNITTLATDPPAINYEPRYEVLEPDEAETQNALIKTLRCISKTTFRDTGHALRSVHAKSHGLLKGELRVLDNLSPTMAQGIFAAGGKWPVVIRFSTVPGDILDDSISTPRGVAIKVLGVEGERLDGSEEDVTQDFVLVTGATFGAATAKKFLHSLKLLAPTTDKAPALKNALSVVLRGTERVLEAVGGESGTLKALGGYPETHILGETFYSQAPILYGPYMAKICVAPVSTRQIELTNSHLDLSGKPNGLREAVLEFFAANGAEWELRVQLCTDLQTMPIEDSSVRWPEDLSPYVPVARITAPQQLAWSAARSRAIDDHMAFSPWHGIVSHRPIGSIMRMRKLAYQTSARFRAEHNHESNPEPRDLDALPA